jgi:succinate-semialdehyde dehydrogenase/glutarate-semialdehyde dehydrogenase
MSDYAVVDPASNSTVKEYPTISDDALTSAIARVDSAHADWKSRSVAERASVIERVAEIYETRGEELGAIITREMGKPIASAIGEVAFTASIYRYYAENAASLLADEPIALLGGSGTAVIRRASIGPLLGIMPWNYPYYQVARFAGPNLLVGNTVLLKPAPQCPESAEMMESIFHESGVPEHAYIGVRATNDQVSTIIADPRVRGVSFTGSDRTGATVAEQAGRHLKKVVLELGGSDPFIVLSTNDLDSLVAAAVGARMANMGQACNAAKRFIVASDLYDEFLEKFTAGMAAIEPGEPSSADTTAGPLSSTRAAETLELQVDRAVEQGAKLEVGGTRDGNYFQPTVLSHVTPSSDAYTQEFFGPVAQVYSADTEEEAVALANATEFGLGSYLFTTDPDQAQRLADQIEAGMVFINTTSGEGPEVPFGGIKRSGFGRELGRLGTEEFVNKKLIRTGS